MCWVLLRNWTTRIPKLDRNLGSFVKKNCLISIHCRLWRSGLCFLWECFYDYQKRCRFFVNNYLTRFFSYIVISKLHCDVVFWNFNRLWLVLFFRELYPSEKLCFRSVGRRVLTVGHVFLRYSNYAPAILPHWCSCNIHALCIYQ